MESQKVYTLWQWGFLNSIYIAIVEPWNIGRYRKDKDIIKIYFDTYPVLYRRGLLNLNKFT